jgi:predicted GTPase
MGNSTSKQEVHDQPRPKISFADGTDDPVVVVIGRVGAGKSTLANRMHGLEDFGNNSFAVSSENNRVNIPGPEVRYGACMGKPENGYLWIMDTPGHDDGDGNDEQNRVMVLEELKRLKVVHAFVLVKNVDERFGNSDKKTLPIIAEKFGGVEEFTKRLIVVLSKLVPCMLTFC